MVYRTRTYIAGDWDHDRDAVECLYYWNDNKYLSLNFTNAHDLMTARDTSLNCSIKKSLKERMDASKRFVLIVGEYTNSVTAGSCQYCENYDRYLQRCKHGYSVNFKSYIKYECEKAIEADIPIIVLYKYLSVNRMKCPESLRNLGIHIPMIIQLTNGKFYWNYQIVKRAFDET